MKDFLTKFKYRKILLCIADAFVILVSALLANFILMLFQHGLARGDLSVSILMGILCCLAGLSLCGAYRKLWRYFNWKDYLSCGAGVLTGIVGSCLFTYILRGSAPIVYMLLYGAIAVIGVSLFRFIFKATFIDLTNVGREEAKYKRTMVIGGGRACALLLKEIHASQEKGTPDKQIKAKFEPVCIIDDDKSKIGKEIEGIQIVGTTYEIDKYIRELNVEQIIFCIPSCLEDERKRILDVCSSTKLPVKVIPFLGNLLFDDKHTTLLGQVRDINVEDLLGRDPIKFDNQDIQNFISHKVCMVTGGGGSIGSELVRQIAKYQPKQVIIVDIYENNAYDIQQELLMEYGDSLNLVTLIASVRDYYRMNQIFQRYKPEVVFHAAAHKHVPLMEVSPMEAIKNNILGTFNVATLAQFYNVEKFVMISTDKAVNPTNVMGASKRCCEMIVQYLAQQNDGKTKFVTTRFGNVLGSNGSVIPIFKRQIEQGKPVTVTHPDIIRYFMTIPEAVSLVMEAAAIANGSEIFVLDMGKPVKIVTLAENLIRMYGKIPYEDVEIKFVGLRPGEKIKEELLMNEEGLRKTKNELIFIGKQIYINPERFIHQLRVLRDAAFENNEIAAVKALHDIVPTFVTPEEFNQKVLLHS
ncbi:MAG: nucleoside-diphosphate sugar epimerase/dehydratase [Oscillospiraceae bacterium]